MKHIKLVLLAVLITLSVFSVSVAQSKPVSATCGVGNASSPWGQTYIPSNGSGNQLSSTYIQAFWSGHNGDCSGNSGWNVQYKLYTEISTQGYYTEIYASVRVWICGVYQGDWVTNYNGIRNSVSNWVPSQTGFFVYPKSCAVQADDGYSSAYTPYGWGYIGYVGV